MSVIKVDKESEELKSKKFPIFINVKIGQDNNVNKKMKINKVDKVNYKMGQQQS